MNEQEFLDKANEIVEQMYEDHPKASYQKAYMDGWYAFQELVTEYSDTFAKVFGAEKLKQK